MIPRIIFRSVPETTTTEVESYWAGIQDLHPGWQFITYRDPIDATLFPRSSPFWDDCTSGAQLAGLIRLEGMINHGGIWVDSDYEAFRPFDELLEHQAFAAWEDVNVIPDAILGFERNHPALSDMLDEAIRMLPWGAWESGPGVTTRRLQGRADVTLLDPPSFYPVHWSDKTAHTTTELTSKHPESFGWHHYAASWPGSYQG